MSKFQVGTDNFKYIYTQTEMKLHNAPVYKCRRGRQEGTQEVLFLMKAKDGHWVAREAHNLSEEPARDSTKVFRTTHPMEDITQEGNVEWMWWNEDIDRWAQFEYTFKTKKVA